MNIFGFILALKRPGDFDSHRDGMPLHVLCQESSVPSRGGPYHRYRLPHLRKEESLGIPTSTGPILGVLGTTPQIVSAWMAQQDDETRI